MRGTINGIAKGSNITDHGGREVGIASCDCEDCQLTGTNFVEISSAFAMHGRILPLTWDYLTENRYITENLSPILCHQMNHLIISFTHSITSSKVKMNSNVPLCLRTYCEQGKVK